MKQNCVEIYDCTQIPGCGRKEEHNNETNRNDQKTIRAAVSVTLFSALVCGLTACGSQEDAKENGGTYHVGICQWEQHAALDEATKGFQEALTDKLGEEVTFDVQIAQGSTQDCQEILNGFVAANHQALAEHYKELQERIRKVLG